MGGASLMSFINEVHYFRIPVNNLGESIRWYTECLGLKLRRKKENELAVMEIGEGPLLILVEADKDSRGHFIRDGCIEFSIGFTSPEIHKFYEHLITQKVSVDEMKEEEGHYFFHFYDPSGNKLQVHW